MAGHSIRFLADMSLRELPAQCHYLLLSLSLQSTSPDLHPNPDVLTIRKALQDALATLFGITSAGTYIDILALTKYSSLSPSPARSAEDSSWGNVLLRVHPSYVPFCPLFPSKP